MLFNTGCNEQMFSKLLKKFSTDPSYRCREKRKNRTLIRKNYVTKPKARRLGYSNNQQKAVNR